MVTPPPKGVCASGSGSSQPLPTVELVPLGLPSPPAALLLGLCQHGLLWSSVYFLEILRDLGWKPKIRFQKVSKLTRMYINLKIHMHIHTYNRYVDCIICNHLKFNINMVYIYLHAANMHLHIDNICVYVYKIYLDWWDNTQTYKILY